MIYRSILEHIGVNQEVEGLEQQYISLLQHNPDAILIFDVDGRLTFANDAIEDVVGFPAHPLKVMYLLEFIVPAQRKRVLRHIVRVLHGTPQTYETIAIHRDGRQVDISVKNVPIIVDGRTRGYFAIVRDITDKIRAHRELQTTKTLLESFINNATDAISLKDTEGRIMLVNPAFIEMFGWTAEEIVGGQIPIVPPEYAQEMQEISETVRNGGRVTGLETIRIRKDGTRLYTNVSVSPIRDAEGNVIAVAGVSRDITKSKQVEDALRESEARYRLIADNMTDVIGTLDADGRVTFAAPSSTSVLGYHPQTYLGHSLVEMVHPHDQDKVWRQFTLMTETGQPCRTNFRYRHAAGYIGSMEANLTPVIDDEKIVSVVVVARETTERKRTDELLQTSEKLAALGQLAAGVAHEIRNPMTALRGFIHLLREKTEGHDDYFHIMLSELNRVDQIVSEFLMLSKPQVMNVRRKSVGSILKQVIPLMAAEANLRNVEMVLDCDNRVPDVSCDEGQLKQVFINLVKNALEAMPGEGRLEVRVVDRKDHHVAVQFQDDGVGIPEDNLRRIGEPFFTTKSDGTGLGLMVSHKIIEEHGGNLFISSEPGLGTLAEVVLPVCAEEQETHTGPIRRAAGSRLIGPDVTRV